MRKLIVLGLIISLAGVYSVNAASSSEQIKIKINGTPFVPRDADTGERMDIILHNDRTYLPVRSIAEALDVTITWDEQKNTVFITSK